jgi:hypothetical protein|tara:strand:+ start:788 stop:1054 length:267 start_codon:yes stop_codon:yes gene_type:complete
MILEITLGIFVILSLALSYAVYNLLVKQEQLEDWVEDYIDKINEVNTNIRKIDYKGYFEVDDEVGQVFEQLKEEVQSLEELTEINEEN